MQKGRLLDKQSQVSTMNYITKVYLAVLLFSVSTLHKKKWGETANYKVKKKQFYFKLTVLVFLESNHKIRFRLVKNLTSSGYFLSTHLVTHLLQVANNNKLENAAPC